MRGESTIWSVLMNAAGGSFVIVAVALVLYARQSVDTAAGDAAEAIVAASSEDAAPEAADAAAADDASATAEDAGADGAAGEGAADAAAEDPDGGPVAAASTQPVQKQRPPPAKSKFGRTKTKKWR